VLAGAVLLACEVPTETGSRDTQTTVQVPQQPDRRPGPHPGRRHTPTPPTTGTSTIIVYGQVSTRPLIMKGVLGVSLDRSPLQFLGEADSLVYDSLAAGVHRLHLDDHCGRSSRTQWLTVGENSTLRVTVGPIPADCM
jgi:hypothetical protein